MRQRGEEDGEKRISCRCDARIITRKSPTSNVSTSRCWIYSPQSCRFLSKGSAVQHELDLSFGLALYLCRVFIERHQGSVGVQSAPGQGATFWFTLPIIPSPGA
nr:ATP-binding protein [Ktedonobacter sp. SOSP1-52]